MSEDQNLLAKLAKVEGVDYKDLSRLQISRTPTDKQTRRPNNRHHFVDSRQAHICPYCRAILRTRYSLQKHISVRHFNDKPLQCGQCNKGFSCNADLKRHVLHTHQAQEMVACPVCCKEYRSGYIARHKQYAHSKHNVPSKCDLCMQIFKTRESMLKHRRSKHK